MTVALITGAGQGIGLGIAKVLATRGIAVAVADINKATGVTAARALGGNSVFIEADVGRGDSIEAMIEGCVKALGSLDILVNNAAPPRAERVPFADQTTAGWDRDMELMLKGYALTARAAVPAMEKSGGGSIVNLSSVLAHSVSHESAAYHVAKAGIDHLTRYLAYELGPKNIRVNAVAPGLVDRDGGFKLTDDAVNKAVVDVSVPLGRTASAADIGRVVAFLCSDDAGYVTGQTLIVDGGLSLGEPFGVGRRAFRKALEKETAKG